MIPTPAAMDGGEHRRFGRAAIRKEAPFTSPAAGDPRANHLSSSGAQLPGHVSKAAILAAIQK